MSVSRVRVAATTALIASCAGGYFATASLLADPSMPSGISAPTQKSARAQDEVTSARREIESSNEQVGSVDRERFEQSQSPHENSSSGATRSEDGGRLEQASLIEFEAKMASLKRGSRDQTPIIIAETAADREFLISTSIEGQGLTLVEAMSEQVGEKARAQVPKMLSDSARAEFEHAIDSMVRAEFAYGLELREALKIEMRTADLSVKPGNLPSEAAGVHGRLQAVCNKAEGLARIEGYYFVKYEDYPALGATNKLRVQARREFEDLLKAH